VVANHAALTEGLTDQLLPYLDGNHDFAEATSARKFRWSRHQGPGFYLAWLDVGGSSTDGAVEKAAEASKSRRSR
jgi:bifunctional pyridoxal-dependent enzyme with beta-cystathionase and maltose regulon repressor activities